MLICYDAAITSLFLIMWPLRGELGLNVIVFFAVYDV